LSSDKTKVFYQIDEPDNKVTLKSWEIIHIRGLSVDGINGLSPISYHRESIGIGLSEIKFQHPFLQRIGS
jgi:phage portal protein BeeE